MNIVEALTHPSFVLGHKWARPVYEGDTPEDEDLVRIDEDGLLLRHHTWESAIFQVTDFVTPWELVEPPTLCLRCKWHARDASIGRCTKDEKRLPLASLCDDFEEAAP